MSYRAAAALQSAVYQHLTAADSHPDLTGVPVFDAPLEGSFPDLYIGLGAERVRDASTKTSDGAEHRFAVTVTAASGGFLQAKRVAAAVCAQLEAPMEALETGHLAGIAFERAQASRGPSGAARSITLTFRAMIDDI